MLVGTNWGHRRTAVDRHRFVVAIATAALVGVVAACGGSAASPTAAPTEAPTQAPVPTGSSAATEAPSDEATPTIAAHTTAAAKCAGVALRKEPSTDGEVIVRAKAGTKVRVVETVPGDAYEAGSCGTA